MRIWVMIPHIEGQEIHIKLGRKKTFKSLNRRNIVAIFVSLLPVNFFLSHETALKVIVNYFKYKFTCFCFVLVFVSFKIDGILATVGLLKSFRGSSGSKQHLLLSLNRKMCFKFEMYASSKQ